MIIVLDALFKSLTKTLVRTEEIFWKFGKILSRTKKINLFEHFLFD